jgi:putative ABC transport system permease protein
MAIIGVFGCTALIVCALSMNHSMEVLKVWQYEITNKYESKLILSENSNGEQIDGEPIMEDSIEIRANGVKKSGAILVTDNTTLIANTDMNLNPVELSHDGVSITAKLAEKLNVCVGDSVEWHIYGNEGWITGEIAAIYRAPVSQGITMSREYLESLGLTYRTTAILSADVVTTRPNGVETIESTSDASAGWDDMTEAMYIMVYLLIIAAAVLAIVVLYNLGLLSFTEMEREMATLKVMGLKSGKLRGLLLTQNLWFSLIGFALGVPGGLRLIDVIVSYSGDSFDFPVTLSVSVFVISAVFTFGLSVLVNRLFSRKIRRLNMVEVLKSAE